MYERKPGPELRDLAKGSPFELIKARIEQLLRDKPELKLYVTGHRWGVCPSAHAEGSVLAPVQQHVWFLLDCSFHIDTGHERAQALTGMLGVCSLGAALANIFSAALVIPPRGSGHFSGSEWEERFGALYNFGQVLAEQPTSCIPWPYLQVLHSHIHDTSMHAPH